MVAEDTLVAGALSRHGQLIDGDGHLLEDYPGIIERLPAPYREDMKSGVLNPFIYLFPPLDHLHNMPTEMRGAAERAGETVGVSEWKEFLTAVGIEHTVLYPTAGLAYGRIRDYDWASTVCHAYNTWLSEVYVHDSSGKFSGMALIPMQEPQAAAMELRHAVEDLGLRGAMLPSHGLPLQAGSSDYWPVYAEAERLGCALAFHGGSHDGYGFDDFNSFAAVHALGHPFGLLISMASLIFNGVFDRFPGLRVGFLEGGSAWLMLALERFDESYEAFQPYERGAKDLLQLKKGQDVDDYMVELLQQGRMVIGCEGGEHDLEYVIERVGCSPFMYSSDFPHEVDASSCLHELEELDSLSIPDVAKAAILSTTSSNFYRIKL